MVKKILILLSLFLLFSFTASAQCISDWSCTEWSECTITNYNTRNCIDKNKCTVSTNGPIQIKKCTDDNSYPVNAAPTVTSNNEEIKPELISNSEENTNEISNEIVESNIGNNTDNINNTNQNQELNHNSPSLLIGLLIIFGFIVIGLVIGILIKKKENSDQ